MSDKPTTDEMLAARRELTAKKLADLGWEEGVSAGGKACAFETIDGRRTNRILNANVNWYICGGPLEPHATFDAAVDAAHAARFGRTAELNEPITHVEPDVDTPKPARNPRIKVKIGLFYDVKTVADIEKMLRDGRALPSDRLWIFGKDAGSLEETRHQWAELLADDTNNDADGDTCQTSEVDLLRAENDRLHVELEDITSWKDAYYAELHELSKRLGCHTEPQSRIAAVEELRANSERVAALKRAGVLL